MKRDNIGNILRIAAFLTAVLCLTVFGAAGAESKVMKEPTEIVFSEDQLEIDESAAEGYVYTMLGWESQISRPAGSTKRGTARDSLETTEKTIYDCILTQIGEVVAGQRSSTEFLVPLSSVYNSSQLIFSNRNDADDAWDEMTTRWIKNYKSVIKALIADHPYELYWHGLGYGCGTRDGYILAENGKYTVSGNLVAYITVSADYSKSGEENTTEFNTAIPARVTTAKKNMNAIVSANAGKSDINKLVAFKEKICELTDYNYAAADDNSTPYGDPWQLIWVFDNDRSTTVVCEGYSKAYQYLCIQSGLDVISVTGRMNGGGHMWNIVTIDGAHYLADITNSDSGSIGEQGELFLAGTQTKVEGVSYTFTAGFSNRQIKYVYDDDMAGRFGKKLYIVGMNYGASGCDDCSSTLTHHEAVPATCSEEGTEEYWQCSICGKYYADEDGTKGISAPVTIPMLDHTEVVDAAVAPTCTKPGLTAGKHCSVCSAVIVAQDEVPATGHTEADDAAVAPTCTNPGLTAGKHCSVCGAVIVAQDEVPATGHTEVTDEAVAPTCTEDGLTEGSHCSVCNSILKAQEKIAALGHKEVIDQAVPATTEFTGLTEGKHCERCGIVLVAQQVTPKVDPIEAFVTRCYQVILGRGVDEEGLANWSAALKNGSAQASQIIDGIVSSQEYASKNLSHEASVKVLYQAMLGREPDPAGLSAWTKVLDDGYPFGSVINGFCGSTEFINICNSYGIQPGSVNVGPVIPKPADDTPRGKIEAFVKRCYTILLERGVDPTGLKDWSDALETGVAQASQIIDGIVNSQEFQLRGLTNEQKVDCLYQAMLGRGADPDGRAAWVQALADGYPYAAIINGFCGSVEFGNICAEYNIQPGSVEVKGTMVKRVSIQPEGSDPAAPVIRAGYNSEYINEEKIRAFVEHCYASVLGREGDEEGIEAYTKLILDGKKTPKQVAYEFVFSPEFQGKLPGNEAFIRILYKLYLNREPNAEELAGLVAMLEGGTSLEEIVKGFADGAEFRAIVREMKE